MYTFRFSIINISLIAVMHYAVTIQAAQTPKPVDKNMPIPSQQQIQQKTSISDVEQEDVKNNLLAANESFKEELATVKISRDMARQEAQSARNELEQMRNAMSENQSSMDAILNDLQNTKKALADSVITNEILRGSLSEYQNKAKASIKEGDLVTITPGIVPAHPMNLNKINKRNSRNYGVVVVNVLVSENGEVLDARLLQGLPGQGETVDKINAACVEQAKRIIFDPARTADGKTRVRVWQGVGILLS